MSIRKGDTMIAGSDRMWKGTAAELAAALAAHEIPEGKQVMVTDDYDNAYHPRPNWSAAVAITASQLTAGYAAPSDGMIVALIRPASGLNMLITLQINTIPVTRGGEFTSLGWDGAAQCPVSKNDIVKTNNTTVSQLGNSSAYFVPWKD